MEKKEVGGDDGSDETRDVVGKVLGTDFSRQNYNPVYTCIKIIYKIVNCTVKVLDIRTPNKKARNISNAIVKDSVYMLDFV